MRGLIMATLFWLSSALGWPPIPPISAPPWPGLGASLPPLCESPSLRLLESRGDELSEFDDSKPLMNDTP